MVANKELSGIQLFAGNNSLITEFTKAYNVKEIPRFILIDPEGKIVDADAPHPSDPKLIKLFDRLNLYKDWTLIFCISRAMRLFKLDAKKELSHIRFL